MTKTNALGPFELQGRIGRGGMAEVWQAVHTQGGVAAAVKFVTGERATAPSFVQAFIREVQAVAGLEHPAIVGVFDHGRLGEETASAHPTLAAGTPYLVMEYAPDGTLAERVGCIEWSELSLLLLELLDALAFAHARGVIHRDIKPANVLVFDAANGSHVKLSDFGIAHALEPDTNDEATMPATQDSAGTPQYMPPEQLMGQWRDFGPWTDLYALGCMAYELICGVPPFQADNPVKLAIMHANQPPPAMQPRMAVPAGLDAWLQRLLAKSPQDRFRRAADAAWALAHLPAVQRPAVDEADNPEKTAAPSVDTPSRADLADTEFEMGATIAATPPFSPNETDIEETRRFPTLGFSPALHLSAAPHRAAERISTPAPTSSGDAPRRDLVRPPLPATWRRQVLGLTPEIIVGVGLGLFGLREIPFVDREAERDTIWKALRDALDTSTTRAITVRGHSGSGKSRLAEWMSERAHEIGAASMLQATHDPLGGPTDGISGMLERHFGAWGLDRQATFARVLAELTRMHDGTSVDESFLELEARALTELVRGAVDSADVDRSTSYSFSSSTERYQTVARLLQNLCGERAVVLWLDDVQWGEDALGLAEHLLARPLNCPLLVLLTAREEALAEHLSVRARLEKLDARQGCQELSLAPLENRDHAEFVTQLLRLEPSLAQRVVERTEGNPLFAVHLVGDWVDRGVLEPGSSGFQLPQESADDIPDDLDALWTRRLERLVERFGDDLGEAARTTVEMAAALGQHIEPREWKAACAHAGVEIPVELVDRLVEQGLASRGQVGWSFVHGMLVESIERAARAAGRWTRWQGFCASALEVLYPKATATVAKRLAEHLLAANAPEAALAPLLLAARRLSAGGDHEQATELLELRARTMDRLDLADDDRRRVQNWTAAIVSHRDRGEPDQAGELVERVISVAEPAGYVEELGRALRERGELLGQNGHLSQALESFERGEQLLRQCSDRQGLAPLLESKSWTYKTLGRFDEALEALEGAADAYEEARDEVAQANVLNRIGYTWLARGRDDLAQEQSRRGIELARRVGNRLAEAGCWTNLGEIERYRADWDEAWRCYTEAIRLDELCGSRHAHLARFNRVLGIIGAGEYATAQREMRELEPVLVDIGFEWLLPSLYLGLACCSAGLDEWSQWDVLADKWRPLADDAELVERDIAWLADTAARLAVQAGQHERARAVAALAAHQWDALSRESESSPA